METWICYGVSGSLLWSRGLWLKPKVVSRHHEENSSPFLAQHNVAASSSSSNISSLFFLKQISINFYFCLSVCPSNILMSLYFVDCHFFAHSSYHHGPPRCTCHTHYDTPRCFSSDHSQKLCGAQLGVEED